MARKTAILLIDIDCPETSVDHVTAVVKATQENLNIVTAIDPPVILVLRVEGLTRELCDKGLVDRNSMHSWLSAKRYTADAVLPDSRVFIPNGKDAEFVRQVNPYHGRGRRRRPDSVRRVEGGREYCYDGNTVKSNLSMTLEYAMHYSEYKIICVCGHYGRMHTLNRVVRDLRQTEFVPTSMSVYMLLPALQQFIPESSRTLVLTLEEETFEDNFDAIIFPSMNVQRSRLKIIGVSDILRKAGLPTESNLQYQYGDDAIAEVVRTTKELISKNEASALKIRAVICPNHTCAYKNALRRELQNNIPVYSIADLIQLLYTGIRLPKYSWDLSAHIHARNSTSEDQVAGAALASTAGKKRKISPSTQSMGIMQVDGAGYWNKTSIQGDAAHASSYEYHVVYMRPEGFSFECCQTGPSMKKTEWTFADSIILVPPNAPDEAHKYYPSRGSEGQTRCPDKGPIHSDDGTTYIYYGTTIQRNIISAVKKLVSDGVVGISSDCGFMISLNDMVRDIPEVVAAHIPIALSSLALLPFLDKMISDDARIAVLTANGESFNDYFDKLVPPKFQIKRARLKIVGCEGVEGFGEEVADALTVDAQQAANNLSNLVQSIITRYEDEDARYRIRAVLLECTELPGYKKIIQESINPRLPVYDAISLIDFLHSGVVAQT